MRLNDIQTKKLMEYKGKLEVKNLVLNLAITKNRLSYMGDQSPSSIKGITQNLNTILEKYKTAVQTDYAAIINI